MSKTQINDFLQRWRINIPQDRLFLEFRTRVSTTAAQFLGFLEYVDKTTWSEQSLVSTLENKFAEINGSIYRTKNSYIGDDGDSIYTHILDATGFSDLMLILQRLFWSIEEISVSYEKQEQFTRSVQSLIARLNTAIDRSSGINLRHIEVVDGAYELYPEGIKIMDDIVDENVVWLKAYPDVAKEYHNALTIAVSKDSSMYRQALDSLRFALEKFLKIVLGNNTSIEKQKDELLKWMKTKGAHSQIRQNYTTLLT